MNVSAKITRNMVELWFKNLYNSFYKEDYRLISINLKKSFDKNMSNKELKQILKRNFSQKQNHNPVSKKIKWNNKDQTFLYWSVFII